MSKPKLTWLESVPADLTKCHAKRCSNTIVENRLCAQHNALWYAQRCQPAMPNYSGSSKPPDIRDELRPLVEEAEATIAEVQTMPVRSADDVEVLEETISQIRHRQAELRSSLEDKVKPFEEYSERMKKAHQLPDLKLRDALRIAELRIEEYRKSSMPPVNKRSKGNTVTVPK